MRGTVLNFSIQANQGVISGDDGKRYTFTGAEWNLSISPVQGTRVDFDVDSNQAVAIYEDPSSISSVSATQNLKSAGSISKTQKSRTTAGILALLLGGLGIQFFYLDAWGWGLVCVLFFWTYIPAIAGLILGIRYLTITDQEFDRKIKKMQGPFGLIEF